MSEKIGNSPRALSKPGGFSVNSRCSKSSVEGRSGRVQDSMPNPLPEHASRAKSDFSELPL